MKLKLKDLKPNPFRNFDFYPIFPEWVEQLKDSIAHTGYWNGFLAREKNGEYQIPYGHHRKQALEELHGSDFEVEVQIEDMPDYLMRQRMFRENVRNEAQDSAVILHDIQVAKKFPSDWKSIPVEVDSEKWRQHPTLYKIAKFLGRAPGAVERVYLASKELTKEELQGIAPGTAQPIAREIRKQRPSAKARQQIIEEAKESNIGPKTAKARVREIILEQKYGGETVPDKPKEKPDIHLHIFKEILPTAEKLGEQLKELNKFTDFIDFNSTNLSMFGVILEDLQKEIQTFLEAHHEKKILQDPEERTDEIRK